MSHMQVLAICLLFMLSALSNQLYAQNDELVILSCQEADIVARNYENQDLDIYTKELFELFTLGECIEDATDDGWKSLEVDCTTNEILIPDAEGANFMAINDRFQELTRQAVASSIFFKYFYRNVKCGEQEALLVIAMEQSPVTAAHVEIEIGCGVNPDPISIYETWKSDPVTYAEYSTWIPNFDPTPLDLEGFNFEGAQFTDVSGDEIPYDLTAMNCGYAIDWEDGNRIAIDDSGLRYKFFRQWTVYNWCSGQLELVDIIPQVIKICTERNPITRVEEFGTNKITVVDNGSIDFQQNSLNITGNDFMLYQNYPNPVQSQTTIAFSLPEAQLANINITDINGKLVKTIHQNFAEGNNEVLIDTSDLPAGVFSYTLSSAAFSMTKMMLIVN